MKHRKFSTIVLTGSIISSILFLSFFVTGCNKDAVTTPSSSTATVNMSVSFSTSGSVGFLKISNTPSADSLRIDSAVVVFSRIKFESHIDSVLVDTTGGDNDSLDHDHNLVFNGPFVVHVQDTSAINFASQVVPAGTYDGIKFKIHRLQHGEPHEDCDRHHEHLLLDDSSVAGSSITVWGAVYKNGAWTNFTYRFDGELEFKIKGNFTIPDSTSTVDIALNFNMGSWFKNPMTGALLDPSDVSFSNLQLIRRAIYDSFGKGCGGHDRGDGHPEH